MRVATVVPSLRGGGLERVARDVVLSLDRGRVQPGVFCLDGLGVYADDLLAAGVPVTDCTEPALRIRGLPLRLARALYRFRPDVIHAHSGTWYASSVAKTLLRRPRLVFTDHGRYPPEPRSRALVERWCLRRTDRVTAVSSALAAYIGDFLGLSTPPCVVENGIALAEYRQADRSAVRARLREEWSLAASDVVALSVGRFAPVKDHRSLLRALADARRACPELKLVLAGTGRLEPELRTLAAELAIEGAVRFVGFRRDVPDCMAAADLLVISSTTEGLPISLLEALASGLPVLSTAVGGIPAALGEPPAGLLVEPGSSDGLAEGLRQLASQGDLRERAAALALQRAERYSVGAVASRYLCIYEEVLTGDRG